MKSGFKGMIAATALAASAAAGATAPVDVTYQLSGSAGHWVLDFSVTNNMPSTNNAMVVYLFGLNISGGGHLAEPPNWPIYFSAVSTNVLNGSGTTYTTNWVDSHYSTAIGFGQTLSGFSAASPSVAAPLSVEWVAYGVGPNGPDFNFVYTGPASDYIGPVAYNPGFEGIATALAPVPEPGIVALLTAGLALVGFMARRAA